MLKVSAWAGAPGTEAAGVASERHAHCPSSLVSSALQRADSSLLGGGGGGQIFFPVTHLEIQYTLPQQAATPT